ncbi:hypothetical protein FIBSPDRAFT_897786 [Athelia psychrophila]|uniref:Uncharacterized protein n=1 Tax=Athelia psychrophila TaxID=1759441 RepID=A0A166BR76_9AGAM|nr:hypothetical protein FIBSPDRAFT_897786 [Fibularhizoctonia sp. CBS 109695]
MGRGGTAGTWRRSESRRGEELPHTCVGGTGAGSAPVHGCGHVGVNVGEEHACVGVPCMNMWVWTWGWAVSWRGCGGHVAGHGQGAGREGACVRMQARGHLGVMGGGSWRGSGKLAREWVWASTDVGWWAGTNTGWWARGYGCGRVDWAWAGSGEGTGARIWAHGRGSGRGAGAHVHAVWGWAWTWVVRGCGHVGVWVMGGGADTGAGSWELAGEWVWPAAGTPSHLIPGDWGGRREHGGSCHGDHSTPFQNVPFIM